ncbi:hypothetical protein D7X48_12705 [bacterium D16-50]|nr:hypothetical protein D7X48_12705 [bacterium D16-50]
MPRDLKNIFTAHELQILSSIVNVGDAAYRDLMESQRPMFGHPYLSNTRGRIRTKFIQMQCELESHDPKFPFTFSERHFQYNDIIPELRNKNVILHIARSKGPDTLPYAAKYKVSLSDNNNALQRQLVIAPELTPPYCNEPFYALLVFGESNKQTFAVIQFPEPGYQSIAESLPLPLVFPLTDTKATETFERKKAVLKKEFLAHNAGEEIS